MSIIRAPRPAEKYYILDKRISEDRCLSWAARGLLVYLLGKPDNWRVSVTALVNETIDSGKATKRDGVYSLLRELEVAGYMQRGQSRGGGGKFDSIDYLVSEAPHADSPLTAQPYTADTTLISNDLEQVPKSTKKDARPSDTRPVAGEREPRKPKPVFNPAVIDVPDWLDRDLWAAWCDERKVRRKPISARAAAMQIKKLAEYRDQGYSPQEVIEHSIAGGYQGLFAPTRSKSHETSRSDNRRETPLEAGMREHANLLRRIENGTVHEWLADGDGEALEPWGEPKRIGR